MFGEVNTEEFVNKCAGHARAGTHRSAPERRRTEDRGQALMLVKMGVFSRSPRQATWKNSHLRVVESRFGSKTLPGLGFNVIGGDRGAVALFS